MLFLNDKNVPQKTFKPPIKTVFVVNPLYSLLKQGYLVLYMESTVY